MVDHEDIHDFDRICRILHGVCSVNKTGTCFHKYVTLYIPNAHNQQSNNVMKKRNMYNAQFIRSPMKIKASEINIEGAKAFAILRSFFTGAILAEPEV